MQYSNEDLNLMLIFFTAINISFIENGHIFDGEFHVSTFFHMFFFYFIIVNALYLYV